MRAPSNHVWKLEESDNDVLVVHKFHLLGEGTELASCADADYTPIAKLRLPSAHGCPALVGRSTFCRWSSARQFCTRRAETAS